MSITENSAKHKEVNIKWLKKELQQAEDIVDQFQNWVDKYEDEVNTSHSSNIFQQKEFWMGQSATKRNIYTYHEIMISDLFY